TQALWWLFDRNDMPLETWLFGPALVDAEADPATLNWLAWRLIKAPRAAHHDEDREQALNTARLRLSEHIEQRFIVSDEALRTVSLGALPTYFAAVSDVLDGQQREAWSQRVQQAWASSDEAVGALSAGQLDGIRRALASVDRPASHELTLRWLKHCPALADVSAGELAVLTRRALSAASLDAAQRMALAEALEALMKANLDEAAPLDFEANIAVLRMWRAVDNREKAIEWTLRSVDRLVGTAEARQQANVRQLELAADYLVTYGLYGEEHPHDALAMAVAHQAAEGKLDVRQPDVIARATSAPGSHQIVEAALSDPQGHPRPGVAEVLAWGARYAGTLEAWKKQLDERVDQEGLGGDGRALWLLARGYASAVGQVRFAPLAGETFYAQAMAEADTEAVRLLAVERLIDGRAWDGEFERAMQLIDSVTGQFTDESIVQKLADRKQRLQVALNRASNRAELSMQQAATHTDPAWRAEIERRLQRAIDRNDQQRIRRYQRQLGVLDHQP
ncbi:MAG: hypothetical protein JJU36_01850, partial [Phycisphaeraceae bacterium]|nr:hypothetical protein [Phycisphaeraceae bacterium]